MAVGALAAATIIVLAVRKPPLEQVAIAAAPDARPRLLVVLGAALGAPAPSRSPPSSRRPPSAAPYPRCF